MLKRIKRTLIILFILMFMINISCYSVKTVKGENETCTLMPEIKPDPLYDVLPTIGETKRAVNDMCSRQQTVFTENLCQLENDEVMFYAQDGAVWFSDNGVWFELREEIKSHESRVMSLESPDFGFGNWDSELTTNNYELSTKEYRRVVLKQELVGSNQVRPVGRNRLSWDNNYFFGSDSSLWSTNVPNYQEVWFNNIYDNIDLRYYKTVKGLKYDYIVHPGGDLENIRIRYGGISKLLIDDNGNLVIQTPLTDLVENRPFIYQELNGQKIEIAGEFHLINEIEYAFRILDDYDCDQPLIIDPLLEYSTFLGGGSTDNGYGIDVDNLGNTYVTGKTYSSNFPTTPGVHDRQKSSYYDIFVSKFDHNGSSLVYSTYIGGSGHDYGYDIAVDSNDDIFITGATKSSDFPTTANAYDTSKGAGYYAPFALKLNFNGSKLLYSTFVHGTGSSSIDEGRSIAIDSSGNAYIAGVTCSTDFDTTSGAFSTTINGQDDGFVFKINDTGQQLVYSTFIGGTGNDRCFGIAVDIYGNAYVTGETASSDFPNTTGALDNDLSGTYDAFILKLNQTGKGVVYSTYIGGSLSDHGYSISIDPKGKAVISGETTSTDFPTTPGVTDRLHNGNFDCFVLKINTTGQKLIYSTFIGGSSIDYCRDLALDSAGNVYLTGYTVSSDFPTTPDCYNNVLIGYDIFLLKLSKDASGLLYSTFIGGSLTEYGESVAVDPYGGAYVIGSVSSSNFPTTTGVYDTSYAGNWDAVVFKFSFKPRFGITSLELMMNNIATSTAYAKAGVYSFRIFIIHTENTTDLNNVYLALDPTGSNILLRWNSSSGLLTKTNDPENYLTLEPSSKVYNRLVMWVLDFNVTFNWNYPKEGQLGVQAKATSTSLPTAWFNATEFFRVENDIGFIGELVVKDENTQTLSNNDLVAGGTRILLSGPKVVYENTTNIYPPDDEYNITLCDPFARVWQVPSNPGVELNFEIIIPNITIYENYTLMLDITGVPMDCIFGNRSFRLRIDSNNVTFDVLNPGNATWNRALDVLVEVLISDHGGSMVDGDYIWRSISTDNGTVFTGWEKIQNIYSDTHVTVREKLLFKEGTENLIKWRASDLVGNGPTVSRVHRILVDTEELSFTSAWPENDDVLKNTLVDFGITISDKTSGVNASSIQYSVSFDKGSTWNAWKCVTGLRLENGKKVGVHINDTFPNGTSNMLRWRAWDLAGNGPTNSPVYLINVDTWQEVKKPNVILISPPSGLKINYTNVTLIWELEDTDFAGVTYDIYFDTNAPPAMFYPHYNGTTFLMSDLENGKTYYWRVIPTSGGINGSCLSGIWWVEIELDIDIPDEKLNVTISGVDSISLFPGENKRVELIITNNDDIGVFLDLKLDAGEMLRFLFLDDESSMYLTPNNFVTRNLDFKLQETAKPGIYQIIVKVVLADLEKTVVAQHGIAVEIKEPLEPNNNGTGPPIEPVDGSKDNKTEDDSGLSLNDIIIYSIVAVVIIIILSVLGFAIIANRKKRMRENIEQLGGYTIKPSAHQVKVLTIGEPQGLQSVQGATAQKRLEPRLAQLQGTRTAAAATMPFTVAQPPTPQPRVAQTQTTAPMVQPTPQTQAKLQMPQAIEKPQLPPADKSMMGDK